MSRRPDSAQLDLSEVFRRVQQQMLAQLAVGRLFERYLPKAYRAASAFVIDCHGRRSRQIDIAIFDNLHSPLLFPHASGVHVPVESVYAVFEVKPTFSRQWLRDAAEKAASVKALHRVAGRVAGKTVRRPPPILAGLLAAGSVWSQPVFAPNLRRALASLGTGCSVPSEDHLPGTRPSSPARGQSTLSPALHLDIGCSLEYGAFEHTRALRISSPGESLIFFVLRLLERLRAMGPPPAVDLMQYALSLHSFRK